MQGVILDEYVSTELLPAAAHNLADESNLATDHQSIGRSLPRISPAAQMARDQALAQWADQNQTCVLRWYSWPDPALSLGYFQQLKIAAETGAFGRLPIVRRSTGGGAIVHHYELTYSVAMPTNSFKGHLDSLYESVHQTAVRLLNKHGWSAEFVRDQKASGTACVCDPRALLCFDRLSDNDVVIGHSKVLGSAQRRNGSVVLQHGSLLLATSPITPHLIGLIDLENSNAPSADRERQTSQLATRSEFFFSSKNEKKATFLSDLKSAVSQQITVDFGVEWQPTNTSQKSLQGWIDDRQNQIMEERFANPDWIQRR